MSIAGPLRLRPQSPCEPCPTELWRANGLLPPHKKDVVVRRLLDNPSPLFMFNFVLNVDRRTIESLHHVFLSFPFGLCSWSFFTLLGNILLDFHDVIHPPHTQIPPHAFYISQWTYDARPLLPVMLVLVTITKLDNLHNNVSFYAHPIVTYQWRTYCSSLFF
jgi:hypothetical protein